MKNGKTHSMKVQNDVKKDAAGPRRPLRKPPGKPVSPSPPAKPPSGSKPTQPSQPAKPAGK